MIAIHSKYNMAKVFTDHVENTAEVQILNLLDQKFVADAQTRIMFGAARKEILRHS